MSEIVMEPIESSLISHRGHSREDHLLNIRFRTKTGVAGSLYEYGNVTPQLYAEGCEYRNDKGELSFGQWMNRVIKVDPKRFPFRKLEEVGSIPVSETTTDFASGQSLPATTPEVLPPLPEDIEELKKAALALTEKAKAIIISSPDSYQVAETTAVLIARMRDTIERTMRPKIEEARAPYKALLDVLNFYDKPLEFDQARLKSGMSAYKRIEDAKAQAIANKEREERQREAEADARKKAEELKLADAIEAEARGEGRARVRSPVT